MTIKEALTSTVNFPLPDSAIEKALIDGDLIGTNPYAKSDARAVGVCMAGLLFTLITSADVTEDDVWIKLPQRDVLLKVYSALCKQWGLPDVLAPAKPTVKKIAFW
ncbi:hypothetical protein SAMN05421821_105134 [Mucilaginibacter lappiensis]|uniref:Uncharacterized protein n=1 Tax=Mucilaginibacter lappiensis TaxID=354630 RepID=A0ABR6PJB0_9SPHI|nr:DUF6706 family protein [Mucilaginibacter lappiensis]MBB6109716.1 hypothetical protein [Mucilaginibacter lappiensis]SIR12906.1 hypothetical protein SAMN05421821_105134 [Mucilaginibacter lappiensis]